MSFYEQNVARFEKEDYGIFWNLHHGVASNAGGFLMFLYREAGSDI